MKRLIIPKNYKSELGLLDTEIAIKFVKDTFERDLADKLNLTRVSAPLFVFPKTGLNDNLNGYERRVNFDIKNIDSEVEIVQSLAKWKRNALARYQFLPHTGLYTDMNAIRRDDSCDNYHSIYVDQWDWEMVIDKKHRNVDFLKMIVTRIVNSICDTLDETKKQFPVIDLNLNRDVFFITTQELLDMYPNLSAKERENEITKKYKTVFIMNIGGKLSNGEPHDLRAPDYDDWDLNGDIFFYDEVLQSGIELSSMGIRVDADSLVKQLKLANAEDRLAHQYHQDVLNGVLPLTIGGGIGQSRLCMLILQKAHVGEVQVSMWPDEMKDTCEKNEIFLL